jgi:hypothetical protein
VLQTRIQPTILPYPPVKETRLKTLMSVCSNIQRTFCSVHLTHLSAAFPRNTPVYFKFLPKKWNTWTFLNLWGYKNSLKGIARITSTEWNAKGIHLRACRGVHHTDTCHSRPCTRHLTDHVWSLCVSCPGSPFAQPTLIKQANNCLREEYDILGCNAV